MRRVELNYSCVYFSELIFDGPDDELFRVYPLGQNDPIRENIIVVDRDAISQLLLFWRNTSGNLLYGIANNVFDDFEDKLAYFAKTKNSKKCEAKRMCRLIKKLVCNDRTATLNNLTEGKVGNHTLSRFIHFLRFESPNGYHAVVVDSIPIKGLVIEVKKDPKHYFSKVKFEYRSNFVKSGGNYISHYRTFNHIDSINDLSKLLLSVCYNYNAKRG